MKFEDKIDNVDISFIPATKVNIYGIYKYPLDDLIETRRSSETVLPLLWCDGVAFVPYKMNTEDTVNDLTRGIIHLEAVDYSDMPKYEQAIELRSGFGCKVVDVTHSLVYSQIVKFLKKQEEKFKHLQIM
jgi:hypothetical protein